MAFWKRPTALPTIAAIGPANVARSGQEADLPRATAPAIATINIPGVRGTLTNFGRTAEFEDTEARFAALPKPLPRYVNAVTLKALVGKPQETLLHAVDDRWAICGNDHVIDLADSAQRYRLGNIQVYS